MKANYDKTTSDGRRNLELAMSDQALLRGVEPSVVDDLVEQLTVDETQSGEPIIAQGDSTTDVFFILSGVADVTIDKRSIGLRKPGEHIGEMAAIDPGARRCATVLAQGPTVTARISAGALFKLADKHPRLWLNLAKVLATRLRERPVRARNSKPHVFVGSTVESLNVAEHLIRLFNHKPFVAKPWTVDVFRPSGVTVDDLLREADASDFAVMVFAGEDKTTSRKTTQDSPRDNVVLEYGLFLGALGRRERVFIVAPRGVDLKFPSDLHGITRLDYDPSDPLPAALAQVAYAIVEAVERHGPR